MKSEFGRSDPQGISATLQKREVTMCKRQFGPQHLLHREWGGGNPYSPEATRKGSPAAKLRLFKG
jgi:hypothetical protein